MTRRLFIFDEPDRFVPGTVGQPGDRTFYLQARKGRAVVSVVLEKSQVAVLAARMTELLSTVDRPPPAFKPIADDAPLDEPLVEVFRVGAMALAWDPSQRAGDDRGADRRTPVASTRRSPTTATTART